ncbi:MAG: POTRA domain-containing protein [Ignavibacteriaceae bacterium]
MKSFRNFVLILTLIFSTSLFAQQARTYKILGISVEGNKSADASTIISSSGLKIGDEVQIPGDQTLNAIRQLWSLNIFSDVQIINERQVADGIFLLIKVEEYPRLEKVVVEGNDEIDTDDIMEKVNFLRGSILKPQEVAKLIGRIKQLYADDGYLNAEIVPKRYVYYTADTIDNDITVTWRQEKDFSDELPVLMKVMKLL